MATRVTCPIAVLYTVLCYIGKEFEFDHVVLVKNLNIDRVIMGPDCNQNGRTRWKCALKTGSFSKQYMFAQIYILMWCGTLIIGTLHGCPL